MPLLAHYVRSLNADIVCMGASDVQPPAPNGFRAHSLVVAFPRVCDESIAQQFICGFLRFAGSLQGGSLYKLIDGRLGACFWFRLRNLGTTPAALAGFGTVDECPKSPYARSIPDQQELDTRKRLVIDFFITFETIEEREAGFEAASQYLLALSCGSARLATPERSETCPVAHTLVNRGAFIRSRAATRIMSFNALRNLQPFLRAEVNEIVNCARCARGPIGSFMAMFTHVSAACALCKDCFDDVYKKTDEKVIRCYHCKLLRGVCKIEH